MWLTWSRKQNKNTRLPLYSSPFMWRNVPSGGHVGGLHQCVELIASLINVLFFFQLCFPVGSSSPKASNTSYRYKSFISWKNIWTGINKQLCGIIFRCGFIEIWCSSDSQHGTCAAAGATAEKHWTKLCKIELISRRQDVKCTEWLCLNGLNSR